MDCLVCNFAKCRKSLTTTAWVTACSHIFCEEDAANEFGKAFVCPACGTNLSGRFDVVRVDLQPSEQYKSMILAGQKPETMLEICSRAMSFWLYQVKQEMSYQECLASRSRQKNQQLERHYEQILLSTQSELSTLKDQLTSAKKDNEALRKQSNDTSEKLAEKSRQYQKLQAMYDGLRRKCIPASNLDPDYSATLSNGFTRKATFDLTTGDELLNRALLHSGGGLLPSGGALLQSATGMMPPSAGMLAPGGGLLQAGGGMLAPGGLVQAGVNMGAGGDVLHQSILSLHSPAYQNRPEKEFNFRPQATPQRSRGGTADSRKSVP